MVAEGQALRHPRPPSNALKSPPSLSSPIFTTPLTLL